MFRTGRNFIDGIAVDVVRKRVRRINVRVSADGVIHLSVPSWGCTIAEGEAFLRANWKWAVAARAKALARRAAAPGPLTPEQVQALAVLLAELHAAWCARLGEAGVTWKLRTMKTLWGSCHFRKRHVTYNRELARVTEDLVEYVVVHELTHLRVPNHGPAFYLLMDARLPDWRARRRLLNSPAGRVSHGSQPNPGGAILIR